MANTPMPSTTAASRALASGTTRFWIPCTRREAAEESSRTERTRRRGKVRLEKHMVKALPKKVPSQPSTPSAMGRSKEDPSLRFGGGQIDSNRLQRRKIEAAISESGLDAFAAFADGIIRQAHHVEDARLARPNVYLDLDEVGIDSKHGGADSECLPKQDSV